MTVGTALYVPFPSEVEAMSLLGNLERGEGVKERNI